MKHVNIGPETDNGWMYQSKWLKKDEGLWICWDEIIEKCLTVSKSTLRLTLQAGKTIFSN